MSFSVKYKELKDACEVIWYTSEYVMVWTGWVETILRYKEGVKGCKREIPGG